MPIRYVKSAYDRLLRPILPYKFAVFNGVPVSGYSRLFDFTDEMRSYKESNVEALRSQVNSGDDVVIIGGGFGVTSVVAARKAGDTGHVVVYEADADRIQTLRETLQINRVEDICDVVHATVGSTVEVAGSMEGAGEITPSELPDCDVLEMDCEGAEAEVIDGLLISPRVIIVETHPEKAASTESIESQLTAHGYRILSQKPDPADGAVLVAERVT